MSADRIALYRAQLRTAATRQARAHRPRRTVAVTFAAVVGAVLVVGGAFAAQTHWLADGAGQMRIVLTSDQLNHPDGAFVTCTTSAVTDSGNEPAVTCTAIPYALAANCPRLGLLRLRTTRETGLLHRKAASADCGSATALIIGEP